MKSMQELHLFADNENCLRGACAESDASLAASTMGTWDLSMNVAPGEHFRLERDFLITSGLMLYTDHWNCQAHITGACRNDDFVLVLPLNLVENTLCFGQPLCSNTVLAAFQSCVDTVFAAGQKNLLLLINMDLLRQHLSEEEVERYRRMTHSRRLLAPRQHIEDCRDSLLDVLRRTAQEPHSYDGEPGITQLQSDIVSTAVKLLRGSGAPQSDHLPGPSLRRLGYERALHFLGSEPVSQNLSITSLCQTAGVSQRTLEYAFREYIGCSPKTYQKYRRYQKLRCLLLSDDNCASIQEAAMQVGFYEFGRMAGEYQRLFGELPSATFSRRASLPR